MGLGPLDDFFANKLFRGDREATNFSAHLGWALAITLAGKVLGGERGLYIAADSWIVFTLINEFVFHGPEDRRELVLNLVSRLVPAITLFLVQSLWK